MSTETVGLLGMGAQDVHLDFHTAPELCFVTLSQPGLLYWGDLGSCLPDCWWSKMAAGAF